jgi:hypothetical protein
MFTLLSLLLLASSTLAAPFRGSPTLEKRAANASTTPTPQFIEHLQQAPNSLARYAILPPEDFAFDFLEAESFGGGGPDGGVVLANDQIWAGVVDNQIAMLMGFIGPCGMIAPHSHPRAAEIYLNVAGPALMASVIPENGAPVVTTYSHPGTAVVLPRGSMHFIANTGCEPATIVGGFNAENPGALFMSAAYAAFDVETYSAAFGIDTVPLNASQIPNTVVVGRSDCLAKCGLSKDYDISTISKKDLMLGSFAGYLAVENATAAAGWAWNSTSGGNSTGN